MLVLMRRVRLLPNLITAFGLACGLFVIFKMSLVTPEAPPYPVLKAAAVLLLIAAAADMLDGLTARLIRAESDFGQIFDSLADGVTFGVAPAVLTLKSFTLDSEAEVGIILSLAAMLFAICGVLRLVRYSVNPPEGPRRHFTGLPIPAAAAGLVSLTLLLSAPQFPFILSDHVRGLILGATMLALGYLMVSPVRFPALNVLQARLASQNLILLTAFGAVVAFYGIHRYFPIVFAATAWGYLAVGLALAAGRLLTGRSSKTA